MVDLIQFKVTGTVQGVNFRSSTQKEAKKLGLRGWVKNHPSEETVEGLAVGSSEQIQQFQSYLKQGPSAAQVEQVNLTKQQKGISEEEAMKELNGIKGFEVK